MGRHNKLAGDLNKPDVSKTRDLAKYALEKSKLFMKDT
jgi:hypothetical protein